MVDILDIAKFSKLKGHIKVELINAKTGEVESCEEKDNFISVLPDVVYERERLHSIVDYITNNDTILYSRNAYPFMWLIVSDNRDMESAENEIIHWAPVGFAHRYSTYSGGSTQRGSVNKTETEITQNKVKFVYDFPTHACNGTFQSVGFTSDWYVNYNSEETADILNAGLVALKKAVDNITFDHNYMGMAKDGKYIWVCDSRSGKMMSKIDTETWEVATPFAQGTGYRAIDVPTADGNIWVTDGTSSSKIYEISPTTGAVLRTIPTTLNYIRGLIVDTQASTIWVCLDNSSTDASTGVSYNRSIYKIGFDGAIKEFYTPQSSVIKANTIRGLCRCSEGVIGVVSYYYRGDTKGNLILIKKQSGNFIESMPITLNSYIAAPCFCDFNKGIFYQINSNYLYKNRAVGLNSRVLLASPQTKNNTQTMKVTYEISYDPLF